MTTTERRKAIEDAMWRGDTEALFELAPCRCCCDEHHFGPACPAWAYGGCRGYSDYSPRDERAAWEEHYRIHHDMSLEEFYGGSS